MTQDELETRVRNLIADMSAQKLLMDSLIQTLNEAERAALSRHFDSNAERMLHVAQEKATGQTIDALSRSIGHVRTALRHLPPGG